MPHTKLLRGKVNSLILSWNQMLKSGNYLWIVFPLKVAKISVSKSRNSICIAGWEFQAGGSCSASPGRRCSMAAGRLLCRCSPCCSCPALRSAHQRSWALVVWMFLLSKQIWCYQSGKHLKIENVNVAENWTLFHCMWEQKRDFCVLLKLAKFIEDWNKPRISRILKSIASKKM